MGVKARVSLKNETVSVRFNKGAFGDTVIALQAYALHLHDEGCDNYADEVWSIYEKLSKAFDRLYADD